MLLFFTLIVTSQSRRNIPLVTVFESLQDDFKQLSYECTGTSHSSAKSGVTSANLLQRLASRSEELRVDTPTL